MYVGQCCYKVMCTLSSGTRRLLSRFATRKASNELRDVREQEEASQATSGKGLGSRGMNVYLHSTLFFFQGLLG
jgi:hypothetical protein